MRQRTRAMYADFQAHLAKWQSFPGRAEWSAYCDVTLGRMAHLREILSAEEAELHRYLPAQPATGRADASPTNYAAAAWAMKDGLVKQASLRLSD